MYKYDLSKIKDHGVSNNRFYKWQLKKKLVPKKPIVVKFIDKKKSIIYIAVNHTNDKNSSTFRLIDKYVKNSSSLVLLEGIEYSIGLNPKLEAYNETKHAIDICKKKKIEYRGVEGKRNDITGQLLKHFHKKDIILWIILQNYKVFARDGHTEKEFNSDTKILLNKYLKKYFSVGSFVFVKEFEERIGEKFVYGKTDLEIASPNNKGKYITQKIAHLNSMLRDIQILKNIYASINEYDNIIVIIGKNHLYSHFDVLENTFNVKSIRNT